MKSPVSAGEHELLSFFGVPPNSLDADVPWVYNASTYEAVDSATHVSFTISPSYKDVRILLTHRGTLLYELDAIDVDDVRYHCDKGRECLEVVVTKRNSIWLSLNPHIVIRQGMAANPAG